MTSRISPDELDQVAMALAALSNRAISGPPVSAVARDALRAVQELAEWRRREVESTKRWGVRLRDSSVEFVVGGPREAQELAALNPGSEVIQQLHLRWEPVQTTTALAGGVVSDVEDQ